MFLSFMCMFYYSMKMFLGNKKHLLMMLLSLEMMSLIVITMIVFFTSSFTQDFMITMYFMVILVCEAVLGLVLLTLFVRSHSSDYIKSFYIHLC